MEEKVDGLLYGQLFGYDMFYRNFDSETMEYWMNTGEKQTNGNLTQILSYLFWSVHVGILSAQINAFMTLGKSNAEDFIINPPSWWCTHGQMWQASYYLTYQLEIKDISVQKVLRVRHNLVQSIFMMLAVIKMIISHSKSWKYRWISTKITLCYLD